MPELIPIDPNTDVIIDTNKVTAGYFSGNVGTLAKDNLVTASLSATQQNYYLNLQYSSEDQFSVAWGHYAGSGSEAAKETEAVYKHFKNLLLSPDDISSTASNGFLFKGDSPTSGALADTKLNAQTSDGGLYEDGMWFIVAERARMKDRLNKKNWTLSLSGSKGVPGGEDHATSGSIVKLTDDSDSVTGTATIAGVRYNVVSGSDGSIVAASSSRYYGYFYPNVGIIALRASMLSSSAFGLAGNDGHIVSSSFMDIGGTNGNGTGFAFSTGSNNSAWSTEMSLKLAQSMHMAEQKFRSEEDQTAKSYFIRAFANDLNFTNNPTWVSGSDAKIRNAGMIGYPEVFITTVGLYQRGASGPELVAVGKLSGPVLKNYGTESTIKVKLTY